MAETATETTTCPKCEADVRPGSAFCYNCGGQLATDEEPLKAGPDHERKVEPPNPPSAAKTTQPAPGLRSARDIRRREKAFERKHREIGWEPAVGSDLQLLIFAAAVLVFTIIVVVLALYLK